MQSLKGPTGNNGSTGSPQVSSTKLTTGGYHKFTNEELSQIKMLDLRQIMKDKGVRLSWANGQYEARCPFHPAQETGRGLREDNPRAPRLRMNQDKGVWLWNCEGGHHAGTIIDFVMASDGINFPRAVEVLRKMIGTDIVLSKRRMPKLNGNGGSLKEILGPLVEGQKEENLPPPTPPYKGGETSLSPSPSLIEQSEDQATFKYGDLIYQARDLKNARSNALRIILKVIYKDSNFTDRVDLHSARARRSFANQAAERFNLQSAQVEEHLESLMESLEERLIHDPRSMIHDPREMSPEERQEALALLKDPNLLDRLVADLDKLGYVGEAINKKILYLVGTSRLLDKPISAIIRSGSGAGKSALMEQVLSLMPPEDVLLFSRITPQSLFYMGKEVLDRKILAIDEREGSQEADYSIRTLQSRGKLTLAASTKDPKTGQWRTFIREFSARTPYMETSTKERINEENLNRSFELYLDESPEQTKRILEAQRKQAAGLDILNVEEKARLSRLYQNAQRLLEPMEVKIPYELDMELPVAWLRTRRDHERFLSLIRVMALLHQHRGTQDRVIEATKEDYEKAASLAQHVFGNVLAELPRPLSCFYELIKKQVQEHAKDIPVEEYQFSRRDVRTWTNLPDHVVKAYMRALEELEYVLLKRGGGTSRKIYVLASY